MGFELPMLPLAESLRRAAEAKTGEGRYEDVGFVIVGPSVHYAPGRETWLSVYGRILGFARICMGCAHGWMCIVRYSHTCSAWQEGWGEAQCSFHQ